jgi:NADPH:quinone reductase-like Zn-dependent oxidoreductase
VCIPLGYLTAFQMLIRYHRLPPGATVLVIAASGTVSAALLDPGVRRRSHPALPQPTR